MSSLNWSKGRSRTMNDSNLRSREPQAQAVAQELLRKLRHDRLAVFQKFSLFPLVYYAIRCVVIGEYAIFIGVLAALVNNLANIWLLRCSRWSDLAAPIYVGGLYVMVLVIAVFDDLLQSAALWIVILGPILAALTMGVRATKINFLISTLVVAFVAVGDFTLSDLPIRQQNPETLVVLRFVGLFTLSGFSMLANSRSAKMEHEIQARNQEREEARAKMEAAAASKSEFLATMSHEIRTPMNGILGTAQHLAGCKLDETQLGYTRVILHAGHQLMDVLNAILDLSKIEAEKFELRDSKLRLDRMFRDVVKEVSRSFSAQSLSLTRRGGNEPLLVQGDPSRIEQVLRNMLVAVVSCARNHEVEVTLDASGESPCVTVAVPGRRLDERSLDMLQDPAYALSLQSTESQRVALAMKVSHAIVKLMGGDISVKSSMPTGTSLTWCLSKGSVQEDCELTLSGGARVDSEMDCILAHAVLVVDDNEINLRVARMQLEQMGCCVSVAKDGAQAVVLCDQVEFSAIFMDLNMPNLSGVEATRLIRQGSGPNLHTPIIAFTADAYDADLDALDAAGMNGHLTKPFRIEALRRLLSKLELPRVERLAS